MASLSRGESSSQSNPVLDLFTAVGNPTALTDVAVLAFRIFDISTPAKKLVPVQVFPVTAGTFFTLDPTQTAPAGHRLSTGRYFAPYTVDLGEPLGDHKIEWQFNLTALAPQETFFEEFFVFASPIGVPDAYCSLAEVRAEGFVDPPFTDARVNSLIQLATRYVDRVTGRWFSPRTFDAANRYVVDGRQTRVQHLEVPIIRLDKLFIENQGLLGGDLTQIDLNAIRVYNRHLSGQTQPDDRENPQVAFIQSRFFRIHSQGLFPHPRLFPQGRQNVHMEGVFGYTDPDGTSLGITPLLIRQATCRLVARDLLLDSDACEKLNVKQKFRIISDKEGKTTVRLQGLWLKGAFTGDSEIDNILMAYKRPPRIGVT